MSTEGTAIGALHLRGVVLPDGEQRDIYVINNRISFKRPPEVSIVFEKFPCPIRETRVSHRRKPG